LTLKSIGMRTKRLRKKKDLTQAALAERVGVHRIYIAQIEAGTKTPSLPTLAKLAKALGVRVAALVE
jgi:transcriptional regulator with XRE-family HTH domain